MKIVTNGKLYAVRCNGFMGLYRLGRYLDLKDPRFWWNESGYGFPDCWGTYERAQECRGYWKPKRVKEEKNEN